MFPTSMRRSWFPPEDHINTSHLCSAGSESPTCSPMTGSPQDRELPRRAKGLPGYWAVLFVRAVLQHSAELDPTSPLLLFEKIHGEVAIAFAKTERSASGMPLFSRPRTHGPHARVPTTTPSSLPRPSQGSLPARAGSPLAGRVSHPLGEKRNFMESSHPSTGSPGSRAWSLPSLRTVGCVEIGPGDALRRSTTAVGRGQGKPRGGDHPSIWWSETGTSMPSVCSRRPYASR